MSTRLWGIGWTRKAVLAAAAASAAVGLPPSTALAQTAEAGYVAPRLPGTERPDISGIWQAFTTANWNLQGMWDTRTSTRRSRTAPPIGG